MTVIKGRQEACVYPDSNVTSDSESLHLPSTSSSDFESESSTIQRKDACLSLLKDFNYNKKYTGKRKRRRNNNYAELQILSEADENEQTVKLMEDYQTPFAKVLESEFSLEHWHKFVDMSEEDQKEYLQYLPIDIGPRIKTKLNPKLLSMIRRAMKVKKLFCMTMVKTLETEIVTYFLAYPRGAFVVCPSTSFERSIVHSISEHHKLKSITLATIKGDVQVTCYGGGLWKPRENSFYDFVIQLS